jgi:hypothetical protein
MSRGDSGRIVVEVEPELKRRLYATLAVSSSTLKDWFIEAATRYCDDVGQADLFQHGKDSSGTKKGAGDLD